MRNLFIAFLFCLLVISVNNVSSAQIFGEDQSQSFEKPDGDMNIKYILSINYQNNKEGESTATHFCSGSGIIQSNHPHWSGQGADFSAEQGTKGGSEKEDSKRVFVNNAGGVVTCVEFY
jgi:hypothetical protein